MKKVFVISVDLDKKCRRCGKDGATQNGLCMVCMAKGVERGEFGSIIKKAKMNKYWWLKKECKKCIDYPKCPFVETKSEKPRGCSLFKESSRG